MLKSLRLCKKIDQEGCETNQKLGPYGYKVGENHDITLSYCGQYLVGKRWGWGVEVSLIFHLLKTDR